MIARFFARLASRAAHLMGSWQIFFFAVSVVIIWGITGPYFHFSYGWSLFVNTFTTVATFLAVFLIQNVQNRDDAAMKAKLDRIIELLEQNNLTD